ncbi:MAG: exodeoxyribonuclease I [Burkholderiaceae bacterium]
MGAPTFFWHDYETFGVDPRRDRPSQFAGVRTDMQLNEIDAPVMHYCRPAPDFLPDPEACLLTGILPQTCLAQGLAEHAFAAAIESELARPDTIGVGYNSIRFDDEVTRHLFWRSLMDPYAREWQNGCGRWDLLDVVRVAWALRPQGIEWPSHPDGRVSFKLEDLARANDLLHEAAHEALSDVRATIALARLVRDRQPRLWNFCLTLRRKDAVVAQMELAQRQGEPFLHVSGMYGVQSGCVAVVWPLAPHPTNRNEVIVWDLANDPGELATLDVEAIRLRMFTRSDALPEGMQRLPIKTIHLNRSPIVIGDLRTLDPAAAARWNIDLALSRRHAQTLASSAHLLAGLWAGVFERPTDTTARDVDEDLYGGMIGNEDRRSLQSMRGLDSHAIAARRPAFKDPRLDELVFRYLARNFPEALSVPERERWLAHCAHRLHDGAGGATTLAAFFDRIDALGEQADEPTQTILGALVDYATEIAPERE